MLTRSFHNALCDIRRNGITVEEAITKHGEWMVDGEEEKLMKLFRKSRTTQRTHGTGNNARPSHITSVTAPTGCKIRKLKKSAKPCNSKGFAGSLYSGNVYYYFEIKGNDAYIEKGLVVGGTSEDVKCGHFTIDEARKCYKALKNKGFTTKKAAVRKSTKASNSKASSSKKSGKTDSSKTKGNTKKATAKKTGGSKKTTKKSGNTKKTKTTESKTVVLGRTDESYTFTVSGNKVKIAGIIGCSTIHSTTTKANARKLYKALTMQGFRRVA